MSRAIITSSAARVVPGKPSLVETKPSFITPSPTRFLSSLWLIMNRPKWSAYCIASRNRFELATGWPSSEIAMMPASFIRPTSAISAPASPLETAPTG